MRTEALAVARSAAAQGKEALQLKALGQYHEITTTICKLVDAKSVLASGKHDPKWDAMVDALLKLIERHPD